ncbi:MAG: hypothetical protein M0Z61_00990 [Nitrospiraceae bacterium]|nr:hypothetical protein [Nitrospiraceae bacterium]
MSETEGGLRLSALSPEIKEELAPFLNAVVNGFSGGQLHSVYVIGSVLTPDYHPKTSDINTVVLLNHVDPEAIRKLAAIGKPHAKKRKSKKISPPLVMAPGHIKNSMNVFPIEYLNIKLVHETVWGEDLFSELEIDRKDLRLQCERELEIMLVGLRQGYLKMIEDDKRLTEAFFRSIKSYVPLFRGLIYLFGGKTPPVSAHDVIKELSTITGVNTYAFSKVHERKRFGTKLSSQELDTAFEQYYEAANRLSELTDEVKI